MLKVKKNKKVIKPKTVKPKTVVKSKAVRSSAVKNKTIDKPVITKTKTVRKVKAKRDLRETNMDKIAKKRAENKSKSRVRTVRDEETVSMKREKENTVKAYNRISHYKKTLEELAHSDNLFIGIPVSSDGRDEIVKYFDKQHRGLFLKYKQHCKFGMLKRRDSKKAKDFMYSNTRLMLHEGVSMRVNVLGYGKTKYHTGYIFTAKDNGKTDALDYYLESLVNLKRQFKEMLVTSISLVVPTFKNVSNKQVIKRMEEILDDMRPCKIDLITIVEDAKV